MRNFIKSIATGLFFLVTSPVIAFICLFDYGNGNNFRENFRIIAGLGDNK